MRPTQTSTSFSLSMTLRSFGGKFPRLIQCQLSLLVLSNGLQSFLPFYITLKKKLPSGWPTVTSISLTPELCCPPVHRSIIVKPICFLGICALRVLGIQGRKSPRPFPCFYWLLWILWTFLVLLHPFWGSIYTVIFLAPQFHPFPLFWHITGQSKTFSWSESSCSETQTGSLEQYIMGLF